MQLFVALGPNIRKSPYFDATLADGMVGVSVYNHMYLPGNFGDPEGEYNRLINGVAMWDVAAQRQVELCGPDATALMQYMTTRDVTKTKIGQGRYVPICNYNGDLINDPVLLKLDEDRYWMSIADSDIELWATAIAAERNLDVRVFEPDVSPMAVQGPKAEDLIADLFGDWVRDIKYFGFKTTELQGIPLVLARSGWSKQGGFELYLTDAKRGGDLWEIVKQAGQTYDIGPGAPNDAERIESGLLSYGSDARHLTYPANPFELGLGKLVDFECPDDFIGRAALQKIAAKGAKRRLTGYFISGPKLSNFQHQRAVICDGQDIGMITEAAYSPRLKRNIGFGLINVAHGDNPAPLSVEIDGKTFGVETSNLPFL